VPPGRRRGGTYQAMQLVVGLQQVQPLAFVARNRHRLQPLVFLGDMVIEGNQAVRTTDLVPEFVGRRLVLDVVVWRIPTESHGLFGKRRDGCWWRCVSEKDTCGYRKPCEWLRAELTYLCEDVGVQSRAGRKIASDR
jgi:hypothetical protein